MIKGSLLEYALLGNFDAALDLLPQAQWTRVDVGGRTFLHYACLNNNYSAVKRLIEAGADVNAEDSDGMAPIDLANLGCAQETMQALLDAGSRPPSREPPQFQFYVRVIGAE